MYARIFFVLVITKGIRIGSWYKPLCTLSASKSTAETARGKCGSFYVHANTVLFESVVFVP
jgi:hypothetical protein